MTYSAAIARGSGVLEVFVRVDGYPYVMGTSPDAPTDSWYTGGGFSYHQGLRVNTLRMGCDARPGECWPDTKGFDCEAEDPDDTLKAQLITLESAVSTEITESLTATATTINVLSTAEFASSGAAHINQEAFAYTGKTATSFTGVTRGYYGSQAVEHIYDADAVPECMPEVVAIPVDLVGRRVVVYAAERQNGTLSATEQVWVGWVSYTTETLPGILRFSVDHILNAVAKGQVFSWMPAGRMRGLYVPNFAGVRWGRVTLNHVSTVDVVTSGTSQHYETVEDLIADAITAITAVANWEMGRAPDGRLWIEYTSTSPSPIRIAGRHIEDDGGLMNILGFTQGNQYFELPPSGGRVVAEEWPASVFGVTNSWLAAIENRIYLRTGEAQYFVESYARIQYKGGDDLGAVPIFDINTTDDYVVVGSHSDFGGVPWAGEVLVRGDDGAPVLAQVWGLHSLRLHEAVRLLWSGQGYSGAPALGYTAPNRWLAKPCLRDGDVDWDELKRLVDAAPSAISTVEYEISEPTDLGEILTGPLVACGIYAYVKNDGTVGWARAVQPSQAEADVSVTASWIDAERVAETTTTHGIESLLNAAKLVFESQYKTDTLFQKKTMFIIDQRSLQRYAGQLARDMLNPLGPLSKQAKELTIYTNPETISRLLDERDEITRHVASTVGGLLSRPRPGCRLPVTPQARSIAIGQAILLTCEWLENKATGATGVTSKVCLVLGWERTFEMKRATDYLRLMMIDDPPGAIAPAARATAWDAGSKTLTFADTGLYHSSEDSTDLDYFEAGDAVQVFAENSATPTVHEPTVGVVNTTAGTMTLTTAPGITVPAIVRFQQYVDCSNDQTSEGWVWVADDADGEVQDTRDGYRWA